jgi:hypothetical protein
MVRINCVYNDQGAWCKNKKIKRSIFGIGARVCLDFEKEGICNIREKYIRPDFRTGNTKLGE